MSAAVFPSLVGLGWEFERKPKFRNIVQESVSGFEDRIGLMLYPRFVYTLNYDMLRGDATNLEFQTLFAFFCARRARFDSFLFTDPDDYTVTAQGIGTGDGSTTEFQLVRAMTGTGGVSFVMPIIAPNVVSEVRVDGAPVNPADYAVDADTGLITFDVAPGNGLAIVADFTYYWRCRFDADEMDFRKFMYQLWRADGLQFKTLLNGD